MIIFQKLMLYDEWGFHCCWVIAHVEAIDNIQSDIELFVCHQNVVTLLR